jgi:hypothetical protein
VGCFRSKCRSEICISREATSTPPKATKVGCHDQGCIRIRERRTYIFIGYVQGTILMLGIHHSMSNTDASNRHDIREWNLARRLIHIRVETRSRRHVDDCNAVYMYIPYMYHTCMLWYCLMHPFRAYSALCK